MTLQTFEEEELLARIRRIERELERLYRLCEEILGDLRPPYPKTTGVVVVPIP